MQHVAFPLFVYCYKKNAEVIIAADGRALELLKQEFPQLQFIPFKGYEINYSKSIPLFFKILFSIPKIFSGIKKEHAALDKIIDEHKIDVVISDNRYGCWNTKIKSIFITHQLMIKTPFAEKIVHRIVSNYIKKYDECWVPDLDGQMNLSGDLAHKYTLLPNIFFVGALSRFDVSTPYQFHLTKKPTHIFQQDQFDNAREQSDLVEDLALTLKAKNEIAEYDVMAIVSGPEPQRTIFERIVAEQLFNSKLKALIVLGLPEDKKKIEEKGTVKMVSHLNAAEMQQAILNSNIIISRSGYSTIMDLATLGKKAIFIATPGQTEQEYLSDLFSKRKIAYSQKQSQFNLLKAIKGIRTPIQALKG
jgi:UDP-N-acetylglucosamine transferase subunit ALG13